MKSLYRFFHSDASGGVVLMLAAVLAMVVANSPLYPAYQAALKPSLFWINDLLMAFFFLLAGLEIKRELKTGALSSPSRAFLPVAAAAGGMLVPALIFLAVNLDTPRFYHGWAIPTATDIAFALGALALVSSRVPVALKILLTAIAVIDDLGAILVIAVFYTDHLNVMALGLTALFSAALYGLNRFNVRSYMPYFMIGTGLWTAMLWSGLHPTLAGVILAFAIPTPDLKRLQNVIHPYVVFGVLPVFGFANAGVSLAGFDFGDLFHPVTLGIALGLFIGKQIGIFGTIYVLVKMRICALSDGLTWPQVYGMSLLCGVGFTMALFVGGLAFTGDTMAAYVRVGVLAGSLLSAVLGCTVLYKVSHPPAPK